MLYLGYNGGVFMGPMVFWLGSILEAFIFNEMNSKRIYKDLADRGYKFKFTDDKVVDLKETPMYLRFIPIFNLLSTANCILEYNYLVDNTIAFLKEEDMVLPMTAEEKKYYQMKPTAKTALLIAESDYQRRKFGNTIVIRCNEGDSKVTYYFDFANERINLLTIEGLLEKASNEEVTIILSEIINATLQSKFREYGSVAGYYKAIMDGMEPVSYIIVNEIVDVKTEDIKEDTKIQLTRKPKDKKI